jgi:hypothetical protein
MQRASCTTGARRFWPETRTVVAGIALAASLLANGMAWAQATFQGLPHVPGTVGDQLVYFFDARTNRTTFLTVGNTATTNSVLLEFVYYSESLDNRLAEQVISVPGGGAIVVDPTSVTGVPGNAGLIVVTPIVSETDHTPVVPPRPLVGGFSIVNIALGAGFGDNPFGRLALVGPPGGGLAVRANPGSLVDGAGASYQSIQPRTVEPSLTLPVYLNPTSLGSPDQDGNRVLFAAFRDQYAAAVGPGNSARFNLTPITVNLTVNFFNSSNGQKIVTSRAFSVNAVDLDSLQDIAGSGVTFTQSGRLELTVSAAFGLPVDSFFGTSAEALGTFAFGQRLIAVDIP